MDRLRELLEHDQVMETSANQGPAELEVFAFSIEDALKEAAKFWNTSLLNLEYEILERGKSGFLGFGRKPMKILVKKTKSLSLGVELLGGAGEAEVEFSANEDGSFHVIPRTHSLMVKVTPPKGQGKSVNFDVAKAILANKGITGYDENLLRKAVQNASGQWVKIGDRSPTPGDAKISFQISTDEMKAFMVVTRPEKGGGFPENDEVINLLKAKKVFYGVKEDAITQAFENELYNVPVIVAEGDYPEDGKDAQIHYHFKTDSDKAVVKVKEDGSVDFHDLDVVQSVVAGQILAVKEPAGKGKPGKTITGRVLPARDGKDVPLLPGNNNHLSPDGLQLISDINGQVVFKNGRINVEPVYEVRGDVGPSTGDVNFPGNVVVYGNVNDTFKVYAGGNVEIKGNVGKAHITAEGNLVVRQGIQGKDEAQIVCGGDLYAKFIERATIRAEGDIVVTEAILHSDVSSKKRVFCQGGRRSQIGGGRIRAFQEINAKFLGTEAYAETILEAGIDPDAEDKLMTLITQRDNIKKQLPDINKQVTNYSMLLASGPLPPDKEILYNELVAKQTELKTILQETEDQIAEIQKYIDGLAAEAKISASKTVYPGVKIKIKNAVLQVKSDFQFVTFSLGEGSQVKISPYEQAKGMEETLQKVMGSRRR
ncbi:FapA family protein [Thermospira aquatica]|uniref:FapA family protein n=1 Tax=Thermospira aquatica TaxID=2828656 RepID=A0AAX3BEQ2_9SPIR|nr:FapA family protein [Thermospira aquatica]URA10691.1 FapA family protein [Thermospira aquatica]